MSIEKHSSLSVMLTTTDQIPQKNNKKVILFSFTLTLFRRCDDGNIISQNLYEFLLFYIQYANIVKYVTVESISLIL